MVVRDILSWSRGGKLLSLVSLVLRAEHQKRKPGSDVGGVMGIGSLHCPPEEFWCLVESAPEAILVTESHGACE